MKDSGIPWIGMIPSDWIILPIKRVKDKTHPYPIGDGDHGSIKPEDYIDEGIPYIRVQNMSWGGPIIMENIAYISEKVNELNKKSELHPNDILVAKTGATIGKTCIIPANMPKANTTSSVGKVTVGKDFSSKYIFYLLGSEVCIRQMWLKAGQKSAQPGFNIDELVDFKIPIPQDLPTQQRIADFLDRKCAEIDELAALQETMIAELKRYKQSVITEAVTKGLDPNVAMKDSGVEWIGEIPKGWEYIPIKRVKDKSPNAFVDGPFGSNLKSEHFIENGDVYVIESGNITTGKFVYKDFKTISLEHFKTIQRSECKGDDIIIAKIGANYGMAGELPLLDKPSVVSGNSLKITLDNKKILNSIFVYFMFASKKNDGFKDMVQENAQPALSLGGLNNYKICVPPFSEQRAIADYLDKKCAEIDELIAIKQQKIEALKEYKKSVIFEYVTGKKEVEG